MPQFDLPLEELREYRPTVARPQDFDQFWEDTIAESRAAGGSASSTQWDGPSALIEMRDVTFPGFLGEPIKGWLALPRGMREPLPTVVHFIGYGGGRGLPIRHLEWPNAGFAFLVMDTRGQGSTWTIGHTPDPHGTGPSHPGMMTKGIEDPSTYYYRRVFTDAVRAIDYAASLPEVDSERIAVHGHSQGGGISIAAAALSGKVSAMMADAPYLSHYRRAMQISDAQPYQELVRYLAVHHDAEERVFETLSYFDAVNFAPRITVPSLMSVGLMDPICPPSTVYAAANRMPCNPQMEVYPYNLHEAGGDTHSVTQVRWLTALFGAARG